MSRLTCLSLRGWTFALVLGAIALPGLAQSPDEFARQWPIQSAQGEDLLRVELTAEVYAALTRPDLGDLVAFDADGTALALEPITLPVPIQQLRPGSRMELPLFRLPVALAANNNERIDLLIERGENGQLRQLRANIGPEDSAQPGEILLLDASAGQDPLQTLIIELMEGVDALDARVELQTSHDLSNWQALGAPQALVKLTQNGLNLEHLRLALGGTRAHYLRILRRDSDAPLPVARIVAEWRPPAAPAEPVASWLELSGEADPKIAGRFVYRLPGPLPVDRIALAPANASGAFTARVATRGSPDAALRERAVQVVFQLGQEPDALRPEPLRFVPLRDAQWVIDSQPPQARAPRVRVGFIAEQVLVLAQGPQPYQLAAGSARGARPHVPLQPVLAQLRSRKGGDWLPPLALLGQGSQLGGDGALHAAPEPIAWRQILLWVVLAGGGLLVAGLVLGLLRADKPAEHKES